MPSPGRTLVPLLVVALAGCDNDTQILHLADLDAAGVFVSDGHRNLGVDDDHVLDVFLGGVTSELGPDTCPRLPRAFSVSVDDVELGVYRGGWRLTSDLHLSDHEWVCEPWRFDWPDGERAHLPDAETSDIVFDDGDEVVAVSIPELRRVDLVDLVGADGGPGRPGEPALVAFVDGWTVPVDRHEGGHVSLAGDDQVFAFGAAGPAATLRLVDGGWALLIPAEAHPGTYDLVPGFPLFRRGEGPEGWTVEAWRVPRSRSVLVEE